MSIIEQLHHEHKQRQARIKNAAVPQKFKQPPRIVEIPNTPFGVAKIKPPPVTCGWKPVEISYNEAWAIEMMNSEYIGVQHPTIQNIQRAVCRFYGITKMDLLSIRRTTPVVRPRMVAMYLSRVLTPHSLPEIGRKFGGKDHTTILSAYKKIGKLMESDDKFAAAVLQIKSQFEGELS